ncbi:MAG: aminotransferase class V-fold PLP-dependent enzyme [Candidatus Hydrogenedentota bacterium]
MRIYLDHNASSPLHPRIKERLAKLGPLGNPSSLHAEGRKARALLDEARGRVAAWAGVGPDGVIFTSGGTEANALAIHAWKSCVIAAGGEKAIRMDGGSHASVRENAPRGEWKITVGIERASLHLCIAAHNETGAIADLDAAVAAARRDGAFLHIDAVQWPHKMAFHTKLREADSFAISGHKLGAPMGAGALIFSRPVEIDPMIRGGGQESGRRSGTPPLAAIVGLGEALALKDEDVARDRWRRLAVRLQDRIRAVLPDEMTELSDCEHGLPGTLLVAFHDLPGDVFAAALDHAGIAVSYGTACSSGEQEPSPALLGTGVSYGLARSAVRFSIGEGNTEEEIDDAADRIARVHATVRSSLMGTG